MGWVAVEDDMFLVLLTWGNEYKVLVPCTLPTQSCQGAGLQG